jgi:spermidine synthase
MEAPIQPAPNPRTKNPASAATALALIGFSAVIGQIVLMRELIVVFNGNEMSLGIMLATWLFWTAAGSSLCSLFKLDGTKARRSCAALECLLAVSLPLTIWALRASKSIFQTVPGELVGPAPMLIASLVCLSLFCLLSGALFVAAARMVETECSVSARIAAGSAYLLEAAGSGLGGILASIVLLRFLDSFQIATIVSLLNLFMAALLIAPCPILFVILSGGRRGDRSRRTCVSSLCRMGGKPRLSTVRAFLPLAVLAASTALLTIFLLIYVAPPLDRQSQQRLWQGFHLVATRDSIYGNLAVTQTGSIRSIYSNGVLLANAPDEAAAEEAVHYALLEHPAPKNVLLIGGGVNGSVAQALRHPTVERVDYVELDPALIGMARQFFPAQSAALDSDPRVHIHFSDGRHYLKTTAAAFDAIILNVPDPQTAQLNRFYTVEFFRSARAHLAPGGVLALELRSSEETIDPGLADFLRCIRRTLSEVFPYVVAIPGDTIHFFAATQPNVLTDDPKILMARLRERNLRTQYVREYFIPFRMMPDRMAQVQQQLQPLPSTPVNRDFAPIAYYFDVVLWSSQFKSSYSGWFRAAAQIPFTRVLSALLILLTLTAALLAFVPSRDQRARSAAASCAAATGFTLIALEIFLLLAFQSIYGYVYHQLAILIGLSMAGIALGSWLALRRIRSLPGPPHSTMAITQLLLALSCPALLLAVSSLEKFTGSATTWLAAQLVLPALAAISGMLGGYQFPIAAEIYLHDRTGRSGLLLRPEAIAPPQAVILSGAQRSRRTCGCSCHSPLQRYSAGSIGALYALDLLGGCAGALLLSTYLIPVFGFWKTAWLCAAINLAPALLAARVRIVEKSLER